MGMETEKSDNFKAHYSNGNIARHAGEMIVITFLREEFDQINPRSNQPEFKMLIDSEVAMSITAARNMVNSVIQQIQKFEEEGKAIANTPPNGKKTDDPMCR